MQKAISEKLKPKKITFLLYQPTLILLQTEIGHPDITVVRAHSFLGGTNHHLLSLFIKVNRQPPPKFKAEPNLKLDEFLSICN